MKRLTTLFRLAVPAVVLGLLVWTMVGCLYIPTWERVDLTGSRQDFRHLTVEKDGPRPVATSRKPEPHAVQAESH